MAHSYYLIKDEIPVIHSSDSGLVWDPTDPFVYLASTYTYPDTASYIYKYSRTSRSLVQSAKVANLWGCYGPPACDLSKRLYYSPPGGLTYTTQYHAAFATSDLHFLGTGRQSTGGHCVAIGRVAGGYTVDLYSPHKLWWHTEGSDLSTGTTTCFAQDEFCTLDDPNSKQPLYKYTVYQADLGSPGGFEAVNFRVNDVVSDGEGNLWIYLNGGDADNVIHHVLWSVTPGGTKTFEGEITDAFPHPSDVLNGLMRWYKGDNSLIISNGSGFVKYSLGTRSVSRTLDGVGTGSAHNYASFHYPDDRYNSLWVADFVMDPSVAVPTNGYPYFPRFREIRMTDLSLGLTLVSREIGQEYPLLIAGNTYHFYSPRDAVLDPERGDIWTSSDTRRWLCVFHFDEIALVPPPTPPGSVPQGTAPFCVPKDTDFDTFTGGNLNNTTSSATVAMNPNDTQKIIS